MKRMIILFLISVSGSAYAQKLSDYGMDKVRMIETDKIIEAEIIPVNSKPGIKPDRFYYWYSDNSIHSSQGGYSGKLLNGRYEAYYLNHNLKEQGTFKKGLKDGVWKNWNEDGTLGQAAHWKNGVLLPENVVSIWERLNILKRKTKRPADSVSNNH